MIREIITVDPKTGESTSNIINNKLYGVYNVISNKTVRQYEHFRIWWKNKNPEIPGSNMEKTNRGYFIDGYNVDLASADQWFAATKNNKNWKPKNFKK